MKNIFITKKTLFKGNEGTEKQCREVPRLWEGLLKKEKWYFLNTSRKQFYLKQVKY